MKMKTTSLTINDLQSNAREDSEVCLPRKIRGNFVSVQRSKGTSYTIKIMEQVILHIYFKETVKDLSQVVIGRMALQLVFCSYLA